MKKSAISNEKICFRMKKSAREQGVLTDGGRDEDTGNWIVISSPEDLFRYNIDVDFVKLDYKPLLVNECNHCDSEGSESSSESDEYCRSPVTSKNSQH